MRTVRELMSLSGRVALVTGGAGHIGRAIAGALAEAGAAVALLDLGERCQYAAEEIANRHGTPTASLSVDLEDTAELARVPDQVSDRLGRLDILINCAALVGTSDLRGWAVPFAEQSVETWRRALEVNLTAAFALSQASAPLLAEHGVGSIVNVGSIYGVVGPDWGLYAGTPLANPAAYAASKGGLIQLTRWLATTLGPKVRVNALSPGGVYRSTPEPFASRYAERTPLKRMATEEDFLGAALFLASDLSAYVTGQNLMVDGGWTAW